MISVALHPVGERDRDELVAMAADYFLELDPRFDPDERFEAHFFDHVTRIGPREVRWIVADGDRCGFVVTELRRHAYRPEKVGVVCEFYVAPKRRRRGVGGQAASAAITGLRSAGAARVEIEIAEGHDAVFAFWDRFGAMPLARRYRLAKAAR